MRPRTILLVATFTMFCDATPQRLEADAHHPPHQFFVEGLVAPVDAGDTHCPVATKALYFCALLPPSHYLVFEKRMKGRKFGLCGLWAVYGELDLDTCPGYRLIHVKRLGNYLAPPPICELKECPPESP